MPFFRPSLSEIDERIYLDISTRLSGMVRTGTQWVRTALLRKEKTVVGVLARAYAGACHLLYGFLAWLAKQRFVHSMEDEFLDAEGATYDVWRKGEECAKGEIDVTGTDGMVVLPLTVYQNDDGRQYQVVSTNPIVNGSARIVLKALEAGVDGNLPAGSILRVIKPIAGVQSEAVVTDDGITNGIDTESNPLFRERILDRKREPPHGGNKHDYEVWAKEVPGVTRSWCLPLWMGEGTVGVMCVCDNDTNDIIPNEEKCREVFEHIESVRPVTAELFVFPPVRQEIDIVTKLSPDTDATRKAVVEALAEFIISEGKPAIVPAEGTYIYGSRISKAISSAVGEHHHSLDDLINDIHVPRNAVPVLRRVIFVDSATGGG